MSEDALKNTARSILNGCKTFNGSSTERKIRFKEQAHSLRSDDAFAFTVSLRCSTQWPSIRPRRSSLKWPPLNPSIVENDANTWLSSSRLLVNESSLKLRPSTIRRTCSMVVV